MASEISKANIARLEDPNGFIAKIVDDEIYKSEKILSSWKRKLVKYNELYKMVQNQRHYEGLARIFVPEILRAVETIVGNLEKMIFGNSPWFEYLSTASQDDAAAQAQTQLTLSQAEDNKFKLKTLDSLRQMAIYGLTVRKLLWDFDENVQKKKVAKFVTKVDPITGKEKVEKSVETITSRETLKDNWDSVPVDLLSFHISDVTVPYSNIQKARWIAEQYMVDKHWIKSKEKNGWISGGKLEEIEETQAYNNSDAERYKATRKQSAGYTTIEHKKAVEIIERWGLLEAKYVYSAADLKELDLDEDDMVETIILIANRKRVIKLEANPFWHNQKPYVLCPYVAQDNEFSGLGVAAIGESLQEELNDTRNQTMDNKTMILMNMWLKGRSAGIKNQDLRIRPMGVIATNDMTGLQPLRPPVLTGIGVNIEGVIKEDLRQSVGAASNLQGIAQSGVQSATESSIVNQTSVGRLGLTAQQYSELILKPTLTFAESLNYQFFDTERVIKVIGEIGIKFRKISPDDIVGAKAVIVRLSIDTDDSPGIRKQQTLQFLTIVQNMPPEVINFHWKLLDKVYKSLFPSGNGLEDLYPAPPGEEDLLEPEDEFLLMKEGVHVKVKQGDDDQKHIQSHEADLEATQYALSPVALKINHQHLLDHYQQMTMKSQQAQMEQMQAMMPPDQGAQTGKSNTGQIPNASPFTSNAPTKGSDLTRNLNGR